MAEGKIRLDFTGVSAGFEPLPSGRYLARIIESKRGTSQAGFPKVEVTFNVLSPSKYKGRRAWVHLSLQQKAIFKLKSLLIACGADKDSLNGEFLFDPNDLKGCECVIHMREKHDDKYGDSSEVFRFSPSVDPDELEGEAEETSGNGSWDELE